MVDKEGIQEICSTVVDRFYSYLVFSYLMEQKNEGLLNIKSLDDLIVIFNSAKEEYREKYEEIYSNDFLISFLEYYGIESKYFEKYSDKRHLFIVLFGFLETIHCSINKHPYFFYLKSRGYIKNDKKDTIYFNKVNDEYSFKEILNNSLVNDIDSISLYLKNYQFGKNDRKFFNIYRYLNDVEKDDILLFSYKPDIMFITFYLLRYSKELNNENLGKALRREERENLEQLKEQEIILGKIADEISAKIKEEIETNPYMSDDFYEMFPHLEPKKIKNTVTKLSGYGVMPIGEFFMSGGQLLNR